MKYSVIIVLLVSVVTIRAQIFNELSDEVKQTILLHAASCSEQEHATKEAVLGLIHGKFDVVDDTTKCFTDCVLEKVGFLVNGVVQENVVQAMFAPVYGEAHVQTVIKLCKEVTGTDKCDSAFKLYQCFYAKHNEQLA